MDELTLTFSNKPAKFTQLDMIKEEEEEIQQKKPTKTIKRSNSILCHSWQVIEEPDFSIEEQTPSPCLPISSLNYSNIKRANSTKTSIGTFNEFPVLVRGLDMETTHTKLSSLNSKEGFWSTLEVSTRLERAKSVTSPARTVRRNSTESSDENYDPKLNSGQLSEDTPKSLYNVHVLEGLLTCKKRKSPEELLANAIFDSYELPDKLTPEAWVRIGFLNGKKIGDIAAKALSEWIMTEDMNRDLKHDFLEDKKLISHLTIDKERISGNSRDLRSDVNEILGNITDEKLNGVLKHQ